MMLPRHVGLAGPSPPPYPAGTMIPAPPPFPPGTFIPAPPPHKKKPHLGCCGLGQDVPTGSTYPVAAGPPVVSTSELQSQLSALQDQQNATSDVLSSILSSSPSVQTSPTDVTGTPSNSTVYVLVGIVAIMAVIGMAK